MASFKTKAIAVAFAAAAGTLALGADYVYHMAYDYSDGSRTGEVFKLSHKGVLCKTWEGQMMTDGYGRVEGQGMTPSFEFSVLDKNVLTQIQQAQRTGEHVELQYRQVKWKMPCVQRREYVAVGVNRINGQGQSVPFVVNVPGPK